MDLAMTLMLPLPLRSPAARRRLALALVLLCLSALAALPGAAQADAPVFAPTFTAGQPVSKTDFPYQSFVPGHISVVPDPDGSGVGVLKYTVDNADQPYPGANPRADLLTRPWYTEGSTLFTSIPVQIPTGLTPFRNSGSSYYQFAEAKDTAASFPSWGLGLMADSLGRDHWFFGSTTEIGTFGDLWLGPVVDGRWHTFVVAALYTARTGKGWLELDMDGQPVTFNMGKFAGQTRATGVTTIVDGAAAWPLDIDSYRSRNTLAGTMTMYHGAPKIGPSLASVTASPPPPAPAPPPAAPAPPPVSVVASPRPLRAAFTTSPNTSAVGQKVAFDATKSTGTAVNYAWSAGRHALGTGPQLTYTFRSAGTKHVQLTITDASGVTSTVRHDHIVLRKRHHAANRRRRCRTGGPSRARPATCRGGSPTRHPHPRVRHRRVHHRRGHHQHRRGHHRRRHHQHHRAHR